MSDRVAEPPEPDDDRWEIVADHPLFGYEVTLDRDDEDEEVIGRIREVWKFRGRNGTGRRRGARHWRDLQHRPRRPRTGVRPGDAFNSPAGFGLSQGERKTTHPRLGGLHQEDRLDTFLFCSRLDKRYSGERQLSPECGSSWRAARSPTKTDVHTIHDGPRPGQNRNSPTSNFFFSLLVANHLWEGGALAPPKPGEAGLWRPIRPATQAKPAGGGSQSPPPASQHDAVSGGGVATPLTAICCEAGSGGGRHA